MPAISYDKSDCGKFEFINHSTAAIIQLNIQEEDDELKSVFFNWGEWGDFIEFIKNLDENG